MARLRLGRQKIAIEQAVVHLRQMSPERLRGQACRNRLVPRRDQLDLLVLGDGVSLVHDS